MAEAAETPTLISYANYEGEGSQNSEVDGFKVITSLKGGTSADGIASALAFHIQNDTGNSTFNKLKKSSMKIACQVSDVTASSYTSDMNIKLVHLN